MILLMGCSPATLHRCAFYYGFSKFLMNWLTNAESAAGKHAPVLGDCKIGLRLENTALQYWPSQTRVTIYVWMCCMREPLRGQPVPAWDHNAPHIIRRQDTTPIICETTEAWWCWGCRSPYQRKQGERYVTIPSHLSFSSVRLKVSTKTGPGSKVSFLPSAFSLRELSTLDTL